MRFLQEKLLCWPSLRQTYNGVIRSDTMYDTLLSPFILSLTTVKSFSTKKSSSSSVLIGMFFRDNEATLNQLPIYKIDKTKRKQFKGKLGIQLFLYFSKYFLGCWINHLFDVQQIILFNLI